MLENGFIKLWRSLLKWEWYDDINTRIVFIHLLLTVSIEDSTWHGIEVKRGCRIASYAKLALETKLTIQQVKTSLAHLTSTGEVARLPHKNFTVFRVNNFDKFQASTYRTTTEQPQINPQSNQQLTNEQQQYKKVKEGRREEGRGGVPDPTPAPSQDFLTLGEYRNVRLTQKQLERLVNDFGKGNVQEYIIRMDEYVQSSGIPPYCNCYVKLRSWMNKDGVKKDSFDVEKYKAFINNFQEDF